MGFAAISLALAIVAAQPDPEPRLLLAAPTRTGVEASPRRLFNAALRAQEKGDLALAVQLFMAARLAPRLSFADELYARGAAQRQVRLLAGRDDDAAAAAAVMIGNHKNEAGDLEALIRTLLRRFDPGHSDALEIANGTLMSVRFHRPTGRVWIEIEIDGAERRLIEADGPIGPFSAGHRVAIVMAKLHGKAAIGWRLIAMGGERSDGWQILSARGVPGAGITPEPL